MQITVSGKQIDLSDALRERVSQELTSVTGKYFEHAQEARITFGRSRLGFICDINLHAARGLTLRGEAEGTDAYSAFDKAAVNVGKRLRRYRRRVNDHARDEAQRTRPESARQIILRAEAEDHEEPDTTPHVARGGDRRSEDRDRAFNGWRGGDANGAGGSSGLDVPRSELGRFERGLPARGRQYWLDRPRGLIRVPDRGIGRAISASGAAPCQDVDRTRSPVPHKERGALGFFRELSDFANPPRGKHAGSGAAGVNEVAQAGGSISSGRSITSGGSISELIEQRTALSRPLRLGWRAHRDRPALPPVCNPNNVPRSWIKLNST